MKCMRCGSKIQANAVFCEPCQKDMEKHPIDPSTPITLPVREKHVAVKRNRKRYLKPEEQIRRLRRTIIWLMALILVLALLLTGAVYLLTNPSDNGPILLPGQNYGTETNPT